jgi:GTP:adenosylcobinamide-phosphate guanylyltransferase
MAAPQSFSVIVLAAQRTGLVNPLAERAGVSHKCLAPIAGKPLIVHVVEALAGFPGLASATISIEAEVHGVLRALLAPITARGVAIRFCTSSTNIVDSVLAAIEGQQAPYLVTTADNVLLTHQSIAETLAAMREADVTATLAAQASVLAIHPQAQRRFYAFRDGGYANCNLYGIAGPGALAAAEIFRTGGQFMNNPARLIPAFGLVNIALMRLRRLTLAGAMARISRRFGLTFRPVVPEDGAIAVDVDDERTYAIAETVLEQRMRSEGHARASTGSA